MNQAAQGDPHTTTLRDYLRILRQHRIGIVLIVVGIVVTTVALTAQVSKSYRAESSIQLRDVTQDVGLIGRVDVLPTNPAVSASQAADLVRSVQVSTQVRDELNSPLSIRELRSKVTGNVELRTNLVIVTAVDDGARDAKILADEFARQTAKYLNAQQRARLIGAQRSLERELKRVLTRVRDKDSPTRDTDALTASAYRQEIAQLASLQRFSKAAVLVESADLPAAPFSPRPVRNAVIALILGLTLGVGYAFLRNSLDRRLRSADDVRREFPYALLGMLSGDALGATAVPTPGGRVMPATDIEAARIIRTNLGYLDVDDPAKLIAVTSALPAEGKSTVASAVATASALSGQLTLLIECDLRRPSLAGRLGIERSPGLSDYLGGNATPAEVLQTVRLRPDQQEGGPTLVCIAAGTPVARPAELLESQRMRDLLAEVRDAYDLVILDTSPVLPVVDTLRLIPAVDALAVCVRSNETTREQARALIDALSNLPARPTGTVITGIRPENEETYTYYSYAYVGAGK